MTGIGDKSPQRVASYDDATVGETIVKELYQRTENENLNTRFLRNSSQLSPRPLTL